VDRKKMSKKDIKPKAASAAVPKNKKGGLGLGVYVFVALLAAGAYFTGFLDYGIEDYEKFHHDRVKSFYGTILVDYHEYHGGYLTFGLWRNLTTGEKINKFEDAAENLYDEIARRAGITSKTDVLDVACGMASQDVYLYNKYKCNITAVDLLDKHVAIGRQKLVKAGIQDKVRLINASGTALPFPDNSFGVVMNAEGGPHMHTREAFFKETMRVLRPGGVFSFSETTVAPPEKQSLLVRIAYRITGYLWRCSLDNMYDNAEYIRRLEAIGFTNIKLEGVNLDVYPDYQRSSWEDREQLYAVRGRLVTWGGAFIDVLLRALSEYEYIDYVLVTGQKPLTK